MRSLTINQMEDLQGGKFDANCIVSLVGLGASFVGIFAIGGLLGFAVWYAGALTSGISTGLSCRD